MRKSTLIAAVVFLALLGAAWVTLQDKPERGITRISFSDVTPDEVTKIVTSGLSNVEMTRDGELWRLASGKRADSVAIGRMLDNVPKIKSSKVVTRKEDRFGELEVDDEKGASYELFAGAEKVADFTIGKSARGGVHVLVDDAVYAVRGVFPTVFQREDGAWIEKKVFQNGADEVEKIEVQLGDSAPYTLVKEESDWKFEDPSILPEGFRFDAAQARNLTNAVINARAKDVLDEDPGDETTGLGGTVDVFTMITKDGERQSMRLGNEAEDKTVYARADGWDEILALFSHSARTLRKAPADMRDLTLMAVDPDAVEKLEVRHPDHTLVLAKQGGSWVVESGTEDVPDDFTLDQTKVRQRVITLRSVRGMGLSADAADLGGSEYTLTATTADGTTARLAFGDEQKFEERDGYLAQGNADGLTYIVPRFARDNILGGLDTFEAQSGGGPGGPGGGGPHGGIDPAQLQNLPPEVRQQLIQQMMREQGAR